MKAPGRWIVRAACAAAVLVAAAGCRDGAGTRRAGEEPMPARPLVQVIAAHADSLMAWPGVAGLYESRLPDGAPCVKILIRTGDPALRARLPKTLEGYPVVIEETGEIRAMPGDTS